jgi:hypothetical protein
MAGGAWWCGAGAGARVAVGRGACCRNHLSSPPHPQLGMGGLIRGEGGWHPMSRDVSDVTVVRASPMAVAPCGPMLLPLACVEGRDGSGMLRQR